MRKIAPLVSGLGFLMLATTALAAPGIPIQVFAPPNSGIDPNTTLTTLFANALRIIFIIATLAVLVMLIIGAFQWIVSGGDKDAVANARKKITNALIGLALLALAFLIVFVVGQILGINILDIRIIPTLSEPVATPTPTPTAR